MFKARQAGSSASRLHLRLSALAWALALAVWLTGCGPGVGGTGTGETNSPAHFGASPASVCAAAVGGVLGCAAGAGAAAPSPEPGAAPVFLADLALGPRVQARVQDNTIDLEAPCTGLQFSGEWGVVAGQAPRFFGSTGSGGAQMPATLQMDLGEAGTATVVVTLRSAAGKVLLGPTHLLVVPDATAPQACP